MSYQKRKIEIREQEAWQRSLATNSSAPAPFDEIDELVADAELDLQPRARRAVSNVLRILDKLETGRGR